MKDLFRAEVLALRLPQFFMKVETGGWFDAQDAMQLFEREALLKDFELSQADASIAFDDVTSEMYRGDLEQIGSGDYAPRAFKLNASERTRFNDYILALPRDAAYVRKIKQKITSMANVFAQKVFTDLLDVDRVAVQPSFALPEAIAPGSNASAIPKSLYVTEAAMGDFERRVINDIANLDSVQWWHRNLSRGKGFRINGYLNHYPDFIVKTRAGRLVVLETKGDDRHNSDSELKLKLGKLWQAKAGSAFHYMMLFETNPLDCAERLSDALRKLAQL